MDGTRTFWSQGLTAQMNRFVRILIHVGDFGSQTATNREKKEKLSSVKHNESMGEERKSQTGKGSSEI